jgi:2-polyprenyl-3-methyl-5-hydroxy-6-metoxy-1,4-benzoquinol methylase
MDAETKELALQTIEQVEDGLRILRSLISEDLKRPETQTTQDSTSKLAQRKPDRFYATSLPASELGPMPEFTDYWPVAIDPARIVPENGNSAKQFRALQITGLMKTPMAGLRVLDCGCGEGFNAREMANSAAKVVGYDVKLDDDWSDRAKENLILTSNKKIVVENAPYDFVVLYDVLDHLQGESPEEFIEWVASLLSDDGRIFVRAHPWTSKTGGHFYESINKAWIHLILTPDELAQLGFFPKEPNLRINRPMAAYELWFDSVGLLVDSKNVKTVEVDPFFTADILERMIKVTWGGNISPDVVMKIISNEYIDYFLRKP